MRYSIDFLSGRPYWPDTGQLPEPLGSGTELVNTTDIDCDDSDPAVNHAATEVCNGIDDDCDGLIDEGLSGTYTGNVAFTTQADVDAWSSCYTIIDGNLTILGAGINDLSPLLNIVEITGNLTVQSNGLASMLGLGGLTTLGGNLTIYFNTSLTTLNGLGTLATVGGNFSMYYNFSLSDCCAVYTLINGGVTGAIVIFFNAAGCNSVAEINSNCVPPPLVGGPNGQTIGTGNVLDQNNDRVDDYRVDIYPNPVSTTLWVKISAKDLSGFIEISDITGRVVSMQPMKEGQHNYRMDVSLLKMGLYFVTVRTEGKKQVMKRV